MNNTESNLISFAPFENLYIAVEATKGESKSFYQAIGFPWMVRDKDRAFLACSGDTLADFSKECAWRILSWSIHLERELKRIFYVDRDALAAKLNEPGAIERFERDFADAGIWSYLREDLQYVFRIRHIHHSGRAPYDAVRVIAYVRDKIGAGQGESIAFKRQDATNGSFGRRSLGHFMLSIMEGMVESYPRDSELRMMISYAFTCAMDGLSDDERSKDAPFVLVDPAEDLPVLGIDGRQWSAALMLGNPSYFDAGDFWIGHKRHHVQIDAIGEDEEKGFILMPNWEFVSTEDRTRLRVAGQDPIWVSRIYKSIWNDWACAHVELALREESDAWKAKVLEPYHSTEIGANVALFQAAYEANRRSGRSVEVLPLSKFQK